LDYYDNRLERLKKTVKEMFVVCKQMMQDLGGTFFVLDTQTKNMTKNLDKKIVYSKLASYVMNPIHNFNNIKDYINLNNTSNKMLFKSHFYHTHEDMFDKNELDQTNVLKNEKTISFYAMINAFLNFVKKYKTYANAITPLLAQGNVELSEISLMAKHIVAFTNNPEDLKSKTFGLLISIVTALISLQSSIYQALSDGYSFYVSMFDAYAFKLEYETPPDFYDHGVFIKTNRYYKFYFTIFLNMLKTQTILEHAFFTSFLRFQNPFYNV
jgi:hypothetical protein